MSADTASPKKLEAQIYALHSIFYPRPHWSDPSPFRSKDVLDLLILMCAAKARRLLRCREELIETCPFELYPAPSQLTDEEWELWPVAAQRRGAEDLKVETWSAIQHVRNRFRGTPVEPHCGGLPYCCILPKKGIVVTAGNIPPELMLKFMAENETPRLGIVGEKMIKAPEWGPGYLRGTGRLCMRWVEILPHAFTALKEHLEAKEQKFWQDVTPVMEALVAKLSGDLAFDRPTRSSAPSRVSLRRPR